MVVNGVVVNWLGGSGSKIRDWCVVLETRKLMSEEKKQYARNCNGRGKRLNRRMSSKRLFLGDRLKTSAGRAFKSGGICSGLKDEFSREQKGLGRRGFGSFNGFSGAQMFA